MDDGFTFTSEHHPIHGMRPVGVVDMTVTCTHNETGLTMSIRTRCHRFNHRHRQAMIDGLRYALLTIEPPPSNEFPPADRRGGPEML